MADKKPANNLIALGAASVLAVYTAGFFKTKAAAERLEALEARVRRPGVMIERHGAQSQALVTTPPSEVSRGKPGFGKAIPTVTPRLDMPEEDVKAPAPAGVAVPARVPSTPKIAQTESTPDKVPAQTKTGVSTHTSTAPPPVPTPAAEPAASAIPEPVNPPAALPAAPAPSASPAPAQPGWKDGTWTGSGSARHGQIQAAVVVDGGRITSARIEQCLMRYSCSVISQLVPQVTERGTPEKIDWVSGATESSNVFYWALMDALNKAK